MFYDEGSFGRKSLRIQSNYKDKQKKHKNNRWQAEDREFRCAHCKRMVFLFPDMGTLHRNHCPYCLYSLHVDTKPGNRASLCRSRMEPVGLTFKHNGFDKYGKKRLGDIMLVHICTACGLVNLNRIASDDSSSEILDVFNRSLTMGREYQKLIRNSGVRLLQSQDFEQLHRALFGK